MTQTPVKSDQATQDGGRVAFVQACWHREIVDQCRDSFLDHAGSLGIARERIELFEVPGSLEIPLMAKRLAGTGRYAVIVASGLITDGGIYRHEFVAGTVIEALMRVQLETDVPVLSAVLTPHHFHDGTEHRAFFYEHFKVKGREAAEACAKTLANLQVLEALAAA